MTRSKKNRRSDANSEVEAEWKAPFAITPAARKLRLMVAGEFSAGKTRLITGLLGADVLPSNVTATALPPVWLVSGASAMATVDQSGIMAPIASLDDVTIENTQYCVISHPAEILKEIEIIDTPGISDPNIPAESWEKMLSYVDAVLWCSNATQAWRQSEKSVWNQFPERLIGSSTLLITHADRMPEQATADRVMRRVRREAKDYFSHFLMASLIKKEDVSLVSDHIRASIVNQIVPAGEYNNKVARFIKEHANALPAMSPEGASRRSIVPRRVVLHDGKSCRNSAINCDNLEQLDDYSTRVESLDQELQSIQNNSSQLVDSDERLDIAEIYRFNEPNEEKSSVTQSGFRRCWEKIALDLDLDDPKSIFEGIEIFLAKLDHALDEELLEMASVNRHRETVSAKVNGISHYGEKV